MSQTVATIYRSRLGVNTGSWFEFQISERELTLRSQTVAALWKAQKPSVSRFTRLGVNNHFQTLYLFKQKTFEYPYYPFLGK